MTQPNLFPHRAPRVHQADVTALIVILSGRGWQTAKQLACHGWSDRKLRALAEASGGQVIGGQSGYALTREVSDAEADHVEAALLSQARKMTARAVEIRKARNRSAAA